jgi:hypothetical protein
MAPPRSMTPQAILRVIYNDDRQIIGLIVPTDSNDSDADDEEEIRPIEAQVIESQSVVDDNGGIIGRYYGPVCFQCPKHPQHLVRATFHPSETRYGKQNPSSLMRCALCYRDEHPPPESEVPKYTIILVVILLYGILGYHVINWAL